MYIWYRWNSKCSFNNWCTSNNFWNSTSE